MGEVQIDAIPRRHRAGNLRGLGILLCTPSFGVLVGLLGQLIRLARLILPGGRKQVRLVADGIQRRVERYFISSGGASHGTPAMFLLDFISGISMLEDPAGSEHAAARS